MSETAQVQSEEPETIDWASLIQVAAVLGWHPHQLYQTTLPEFCLSLDGLSGPHAPAQSTAPMSKDRLLELAEKHRE